MATVGEKHIAERVARILEVVRVGYGPTGELESSKVPISPNDVRMQEREDVDPVRIIVADRLDADVVARDFRTNT